MSRVLLNEVLRKYYGDSAVKINIILEGYKKMNEIYDKIETNINNFKTILRAYSVIDCVPESVKDFEDSFIEMYNDCYDIFIDAIEDENKTTTEYEAEDKGAEESGFDLTED